MAGAGLFTLSFPLMPLFPFFLPFPLNSSSRLERCWSGENGLLSPKDRQSWRNNSSEGAGCIQVVCERGKMPPGRGKR